VFAYLIPLSDVGAGEEGGEGGAGELFEVEVDGLID
jgi:hypothetical protein